MRGAQAASPALVFGSSRGMVGTSVLEATGDVQYSSKHRGGPEQVDLHRTVEEEGAVSGSGPR